MKDLQSDVKCRGWNSFDVPFSTFSLEDSSGVEPMGFSQVHGGGETSSPHDGFYLPVQGLLSRHDRPSIRVLFGRTIPRPRGGARASRRRCKPRTGIWEGKGCLLAG